MYDIATRGSLLVLTLASLIAFTLGASIASAETPATKVLTNAEVERYVATLDQMIAAGIDAENEMKLDPSGARALKQSPAYSQKMLGIIAQHGFDPESFTSVHWNVMMAYAAVEMARQQPKIEEARRKQAEQMAKMKAQLPPEQYEAIARGMAGMNAFADAASDVPDANRKLVESHRAELEKIFEKAR